MVIINYLTKIIYYKPVKIMIEILGLAKIIINIMHYHHIFKLIVTDQSLLFTLKFLFLLCNFLVIKKAIYSFLLVNK